MHHRVREVAKAILPPGTRRWLRGLVRNPPAVGAVRFGDLGRVAPISHSYGFARGQPVDRFYIEGFLGRNSHDVRGRVLEIGDDSYTRRFGGGQVTRSDVLHVKEGTSGATIIADLSAGDDIPSAAFDCVILTQTLQLIYDVPAALRTLHRILVPGGVLLATFPGISKIDPGEWREAWCWSFTEVSARRLFAAAFPGAELTFECHGNVLAAISFLHGLAAEDLDQRRLSVSDPSYPVIIAVRARKAEGAG